MKQDFEHPIPTAVKRSTIPKFRASNAMAVTDGHKTCGFILKHDGEFWAFDKAGELVGEYPTQSAAMRALPRAS